MIISFKKYTNIFLFIFFFLTILSYPMTIYANGFALYGGTGSLNVTPESGPLNTAIGIKGNGFKAKEEIEVVMYRNEDEEIYIKGITADENGNMEFSFLIPSNVGIGYYKIEVRGSEMVLWADYYVTAERNLSLLAFILSVTGAFLAGAGLMFLAINIYQKKYCSAVK